MYFLQGWFTPQKIIKRKVWGSGRKPKAQQFKCLKHKEPYVHNNFSKFGKILWPEAFDLALKTSLDKPVTVMECWHKSELHCPFELPVNGHLKASRCQFNTCHPCGRLDWTVNFVLWHETGVVVNIWGTEVCWAHSLSPIKLRQL